jgi:SAM-dependent methyltransferase
MAHLDYLRSVYELAGRNVVDIGAGDGTFSRQLDQAGAIVTGIEIDSAKVEIASRQLPIGISMQVGRAEFLPLDDNSIDLACFFFSFHHVPMDVQDIALAEVKRILKPSGRFHVVEPFPYGSMFDVVRWVEDETEVRTNSHQVLGGLGESADFKLIANKEYVLIREYPNFEFFVSRIVHPDPDRSAVFPSVKDKMEHTYNSVVSEEDGKRVLHQPCAAYHFELTS